MKAAFSAIPRSRDQEDLVKWAKDVSGLGEAFDTFKEPNIVQMNYEGRWESHLDSFMRETGEGSLSPEHDGDSADEDYM